MGAAPSFQNQRSRRSEKTADYLIDTFVGEKSSPLSSDFWNKLLDLPVNLRWPRDRVLHACELLEKNNQCTRHLAKILICLMWCLNESVSSSWESPMSNKKVVNAVYISSVFLKYCIENGRSNSGFDLYLCLDDSEPMPKDYPRDKNLEVLVMCSVLTYVGSVEVSSNTCILHQELLKFILVMMSTQLCCGPSPGPTDVNSFIDAAMAQESSLASLVIRKLLLNFMKQPNVLWISDTHHPAFFDLNQPGVLQRVGFAAANIVLSPLNFLVNSGSDGLQNQLSDYSLHVLLILIYYRNCNARAVPARDSDVKDSLPEVDTCLFENPYFRALKNAGDVELNQDIEANKSGPHVVLSFASLFDSLATYLANEAAVLLLYALIHGNSDFLDYVLVRSDLDTLLLPILEMLYNAHTRTSNHTYVLLIILLILSEDSSFNASIHKMILPRVTWYQGHLLHQTSLGSLVVIVLIGIVNCNLSKLRDLYLHTTCLATLANMAPHVHQLSAYACQRFVSLFHMLSRKHIKLSKRIDNTSTIGSTEEKSLKESMETELHIYTDFLRIVFEILNAMLTYSLPRNPELVYAIMHRQEIFLPFKGHPRFHELVENIFLVLDFFNSRMDARSKDGEWSVEKVLQLIISNSQSWRGEGMKIFTELHFSYEQQSNPEDFFTPYIWQLTLSRCFSFSSSAINLFPVNKLAGELENEGKQKWINGIGTTR